MNTQSDTDTEPSTNNRQLTVKIDLTLNRTTARRRIGVNKGTSMDLIWRRARKRECRLEPVACQLRPTTCYRASGWLLRLTNI